MSHDQTKVKPTLYRHQSCKQRDVKEALSGKKAF